MVNIPKFFKEGEHTSARLVLPLLPLRDIVVFPFMVAPLFVGRARSVNALTSQRLTDQGEGSTFYDNTVDVRMGRE